MARNKNQHAEQYKTLKTPRRNMHLEEKNPIFCVFQS